MIFHASRGDQIRIADEPWYDAVGFQVFSRTGTATYIAQPLTLAETNPGDRVEPFMRIDRAAAEELFNQLWQLGFRPKDGSGNPGHINALKYHLEDMRRLVFQET